MALERVRCADNVKATCYGRDHDEHVRERARSRVYTVDRARRDVWGARGDLETADGVLCSSARRKKLNFTC